MEYIAAIQTGSNCDFSVNVYTILRKRFEMCDSLWYYRYSLEREIYDQEAIDMAFFSSLIGYLFKMVIIGAVAFCGILLGKKLRDNKDAKTAANTDAEQSEGQAFITKRKKMILK